MNLGYYTGGRNKGKKINVCYICEKGHCGVYNAIVYNDCRCCHNLHAEVGIA